MRAACRAAANIARQLNTLPMGVGPGLNIAAGIFDKLQEISELEGHVSDLILEVVLVCELLNTMARALLGQDAAAAASGASLQTHAGAVSAALQQDSAFSRAAGKVHTKSLEMALGLASKVISDYQAVQVSGGLQKALRASGLHSEIERATNKLVQARRTFCEAVVLNKVLGEPVAQRVAARQEAIVKQAPTGTARLWNNGRLRLYRVDASLDNTPEDRLAGLLVGGERTCMAIQNDKSACSARAKHVVRAAAAAGGARHVVCTCARHACQEGGAAPQSLAFVTDQPVTLTGSKGQTHTYGTLLRMTDDQVQGCRDSPAQWGALQKELEGRTKLDDTECQCAQKDCTAPPKRFYANLGALQAAPAANSHVDLICVCGNHGKALDASNDWRAVYVHPSLKTNTEQVPQNLQELLSYFPGQ